MQNIERLCFVVASEMTVKAFLKEQIIALSKSYDVTLILNTKCMDFAEQNGLRVEVIPLVIERSINPIADLRALFRLVSIFRKCHFDIIHSITPKAGLLAMLASRIIGVRFRIHTFTGQVWATRKGFSRLLLKTMDCLLAASATEVLADSDSQRQFLIEQGVVRKEKISVLADGSISGVNAERFKPDYNIRAAIRNQLSIADDQVILLFLGRLNKDKGVLDLAQAFANLADSNDLLHLLLVGPDEGGLTEEIKQIAKYYRNRVHFVSYTDKPESFFAAVDIFCLPSYREGFGSVIIEAAACAIPAIGSNIYGISDAICNEKTGLLFQAGDKQALATKIEQLVSNPELRLSMGQAALMRARKDFSTKRLVEAWLNYYDGLQ